MDNQITRVALTYRNKSIRVEETFETEFGGDVFSFVISWICKLALRLPDDYVEIFEKYIGEKPVPFDSKHIPKNRFQASVYEAFTIKREPTALEWTEFLNELEAKLVSQDSST